MKLIHVAAAVLNQTPLAWEDNKAHIVAAIHQARQQGVTVLCLPELCITGYGCEDAFHAPGVPRMAEQVLQEILPETRGMLVSLGLPLLHRGGLFNTACLVADEEILGFVAKQHLAGDGIHYEPRWFKPWPNDVHVEARAAGNVYPLGDLIFECGDVLIGFEICEDAWVGSRPGGDLARQSVDLILNPSASHFAFGKHEIRQRFVLEGSRAFNVGYIYANLVGNEAGRTIYDGDAMIASNGHMLAIGPRFSFKDFQLTTALVDIEAVRMARARVGSFQPELQQGHAYCVHTDFQFPGLLPQRSAVRLPSWETGPHLKEEEFTRAVSLGLFDYLRKSRSQGYVVSLSGGADSAAAATLVRLLIELGVQELGRTPFLSRLAHIPELDQAEDEGPDNQELARRLLACAYQATRNSSDTTRQAARGLAQALNAQYYEFELDPIVDRYVALLAEASGRPLTWQQDDLALQNIQARARAPSIWMLANLRGALLLATSNRSEAAVGYATMDGDTCGGISPIAGIDKAFLRQWLCWMETTGPEGIGPQPALAAVNRQQPTAELRPPSAHQTDERDLMPYELLDAIERAGIRDKLTPLEIFQRMRAYLPQYPPGQLGQWVERFCQLWCRNQWKRERYAPSFHLDDENLDPKTWCRFPILSGNFDRELAELRQYVARVEEGLD